MNTQTQEKIGKLVKGMNDLCEGKELYIIMCACTDLLTDILIEMDEVAGDGHDAKDCPYILFSRMLNGMIAFKQGMREGADDETRIH